MINTVLLFRLRTRRERLNWKRERVQNATYHSTIKAMLAHKRSCRGIKDVDADEEESSEDDEDGMWRIDDDANDEDVDMNRNIFHRINQLFGIE